MVYLGTLESQPCHIRWSMWINWYFLGLAISGAISINIPQFKKWIDKSTKSKIEISAMS